MLLVFVSVIASAPEVVQGTPQSHLAFFFKKNSAFFVVDLPSQLGRSPIDPAYKDVAHHNKWAIPWVRLRVQITGLLL
jgi:hypothetical protein